MTATAESLEKPTRRAFCPKGHKYDAPWDDVAAGNGIIPQELCKYCTHKAQQEQRCSDE